MSRRPNSANAGVSLFPFLAVLLCTMGSLVLLLMLIASQTKAQAEAEKALAAKPKIDTEAIRRREEDLQWKIDQLAKSREKTLADVAEHRAQLSHLEEHALRLKKQLADLEAAEALLKTQAAGDQAGRGALAADLEELRRRIAEAEKKLAAEKATGRKPQAFAVVPYDGDKGTRRRPIYIECRGDSIVLQPEGIKFVESDFAGSLGPSNPLATAVRLTSEYLTRGEAYREGEQPYPLLLVRPSGIGSYYAARAGMSSWEGEFGYELIDEDWPLEFPPADPLLSQMLTKAVEEARVRQVMLARAAPSIRNRGPKATFRVSPSGGGIVQEGGGGGYGGSRGARFSADRGGQRGGYQQPSSGGGYSSTRPPDDKFASINNGAPGGNGGGSSGGNMPGHGGAPGGELVAAGPTINGNGGSGLGSPNVGGTGGSGSGMSDDRYGTGAAGAAGGTLGDRYGGVPGSGTGGMGVGGPGVGGPGTGSGVAANGSDPGNGNGGAAANQSTVGDRYAVAGAPGAAAGYPSQPTPGNGPSLGSPTGTGGVAGMNGAAGGLGSNGANSYVGGGPSSGTPGAGGVSSGDPNTFSASGRLGSGSSAADNGVAGQNGFANGYSSTRPTGNDQATGGQPGGTNTGPNGAAGMNGGDSNTSSGVAGTGYGSSESGSTGGGQAGGGAGAGKMTGSNQGGGGGLGASIANSSNSGAGGGAGVSVGDSAGGGGIGVGGGGASGSGPDPSAAQNSSNSQNVPPPGPGEYVEPMSGKRGKNWGLPEEARRSTAITRPIQLYCTANNLTVLNDKGIPDKQIVMEGPTENSVDTIVSTVWDQVTTWGIAGRGMYWKPKLVVHVSPDGAQRFNELKQLLDGSGLEVSGKQIAVAQPVAHGRR